MKRQTTCFVVAVFTLTVATVFASTADQQYAFAEALLQEGESEFALLEFKRFTALYSTDMRVMDARLNIAVVTLGSRGDLAETRNLLGQLVTDSPDTPAGQRAAALIEFIDANSDHEGKPLVRFMQAQMLARQGRPAHAVTAYVELADTWPTATLAPRALLASAKLEQTALNDPEAAIKQLQQLVKRYPDSPLVPEAQYETALSMEALKGAEDPEVVAVYQRVADANPDNAFGAKARERILTLTNTKPLFKRQFDSKLARDYRLVQEGTDDKGWHVTLIELPETITEAQLPATLEQALLNAAAKRQSDKASVRVEAYYNYPVTRAGEAGWIPGRPPSFKIKERKAEDALKDALFDILTR